MKFSLTPERMEPFLLRKVKVLKYVLLSMRLPELILYQHPERLSIQRVFKKASSLCIGNCNGYQI